MQVQCGARSPDTCRDSSCVKWKLSVKQQTSASADHLWQLASKFCGLKRWVPELQFCERIDGDEGMPGCIRFCAGTIKSSTNMMVWVKEKLLSWDPLKKEYSYTILDSNLGFENYMAIFSVSDPGGDGKGLVTWCIELNPLHGQNETDFMCSIRKHLERNIASLEKASQSLS